MRTKKLSIIIPTIEEETIFGLVDELRSKFGMNTEIIIVDKSSDDYYRRLKRTHAKIIRQHDRGVESAIMQGLRAATGSILTSIDADRTHDISGIEEGIRLVGSRKADLVLGNRFGRLNKGSMSPHLMLGNKIISNVYSKLYSRRVHDVLTGLFVMSREAFTAIRNEKPYRAGIAFFAIELAKRGYKIAEVPIEYYPRVSGKSKISKSKIMYGVNIVTHIVRLARDYNPLLIFGGLGMFMLLAGFIIGGYVLLTYIITGQFTFIGRSLISFMLVTMGILSIMVGFILDLLLEIARKSENL
jgi:dolichol-phosphate mannosyltransferase